MKAKNVQQKKSKPKKKKKPQKKLTLLFIFTTLAYLTEPVIPICDKNCQTCQTGTNTCQTCILGYSLNESTNTCSNCSETDRCSQCKRGVCQACELHFYLSREGSTLKCFHCPSGCSKCQSYQKCTECGSFYRLDGENGECKFNWYILLLILGASVLFVVLCGVCSMYCTRAKEKIMEKKRLNAKQKGKNGLEQAGLYKSDRKRKNTRNWENRKNAPLLAQKSTKKAILSFKRKEIPNNSENYEDLANSENSGNYGEKNSEVSSHPKTHSNLNTPSIVQGGGDKSTHGKSQHSLPTYSKKVKVKARSPVKPRSGELHTMSEKGFIHSKK